MLNLRETVNRRNSELKEIGAKISGLLEDTHKVIVKFSEKLDSKFGIDEVEHPPRLKDIIPMAIPTDKAELCKILNIIRRQILFDTGQVLDSFRVPLRNMEIEFGKLNLDQYLSVEGEEVIKDGLDDSIPRSVLPAIANKILEQGTKIISLRESFCRALEKTLTNSKKARAHIDKDVLDALEDPQMQRTKGESLEIYVESLLSEFLRGRECHDLHGRMAFFRRVRGFQYPIVAKAAFNIFERLEKCVEEARQAHT